MEQSVNVALSTQDLKRLALEIAAQLPPGEGDALAVLKYAEEFVRRFLAAGAAG